MATIKEQLETLSAEREDAIDKGKALLATAEKSKEGLTDPIALQIDELTATATVADEAIKALLERDNQIKAKLVPLSGFADYSQRIADTRGIHPPAAPSGDQPTMKIPATVRRFGSLRNFAGVQNGFQPEERAYRFGQWAMAALSAQLPGRYNFQQATAFAKDYLGFEPTAVHGTGGSDTTGSHYFVPDEFGMDIIVLREQYGVARRCLNVVPMRSDTKSEPRHTGGLTAYFTGENAAYTESDTGTDSIGLVAQKITAMSRFSNELDAGSVIDFGDRLVGEISYAFANKEDQCAFNGDGTSTYGGMTGILTQLGTLTASATVGSLVPGAGSSWSTLTLKNFEAVIGRLPQYADVPGCKWIAHKTFAWTVMKSLANAAGGNTSADITSGPGMTFLGYPVEVSQVFPSATASGQIPVVFGNFRQAGMLGDRRQETISFSDTATVGGQSVWERDQIAVKGSQRFDIVIHDFGSNSVAGPIVGLETT